MNSLTRWCFPLALLAFLLGLASTVVVATDRLAPGTLRFGAGTAQATGVIQATQLIFPVQSEPGSAYPNHMASVASNWAWTQEPEWSRPNRDAPSAALTVEPWFHGLGEVNFDMQPPQGTTDWLGGRAMGVAARYDGTYSTLFLGGPPYNPDAAGVKLTGGSTSEPLIAVQEGAQEAAILSVLSVERTPKIALNGGAAPSLSFGLAGASADEVGKGVVRVLGPLGRDNPAINIVSPGRRSTILAVRDKPDDSHPRLRLRADGRIEWNDGSSEPVSLALANGELTAQGTFASTALRVGNGTLVRSIRIVAIDIAPDAVLPGNALTQTFPAAGVSSNSIVFASAPSQPHGVILSAAGTAGADFISLAFVNIGATATRPAAGTYTLLIIDGGDG
jgi:hypothetical protein